MRLDSSRFAMLNRVMAWLGLATGIGLVGAAGWWMANRARFEAGAIAGEGRVIENRQVQWTSGANNTNSHIAYHAMIRFTDRVGQVVTVQDELGLSPPAFSVGQAVPILYDPHSPHHAVVDRGRRVYFIPMAIATVGLLILLGSVQRLNLTQPDSGPQPTAVTLTARQVAS